MRRLLLLCLCLLPLAGAQPDASYETTLYMHGVDTRDFMMTPVAPPEDIVAGPYPGVARTSACLDVPMQTFTSGQHHTWYAYVTPVPPRYEGGRPFDNGMRGIGDDLRLVADEDLRLHWYLAAQGPLEAGTVAPRIVVEATMREGDDLSVGHEAFNSGQRIAYTQTSPADLHPAIDHPQVKHHDVDGTDVYEFILDLPITGNATIPQKESFNLRIDAYMENPVCQRQGAYFTPDLVAFHSSPPLRPRLELTMSEPVRIESLSTRLDGGELVLEARIRAAFGSGDAILSPQGPLSVTGPSVPELSAVDWGHYDSRQQQDRVFVDAGHDPAITASQRWDLANSTAASGTYTLDVWVETMSGANASAQMPFAIGSGTLAQACSLKPPAEPDCIELQETTKKSPAPLAIVALALLAAARRRRDSPS